MNPVWFVAPGRFPDNRGTPLAIRWLAEAWAERGHPTVLWTSGPPQAEDQDAHFVIERVGRRMLRRQTGLSPGRAVNAAAIANRLVRKAKKTNSRVLFHGHHVDGGWAAALAAFRTAQPWVYHAHTRLRDELPQDGQWPTGRRIIGRLLDETLRRAPAQLAYSANDLSSGSTAHRAVVPPVLPSIEIKRIEARRAVPADRPAAVYLGNPDGYQNLEALMGLALSNPSLEIRCISHDPPTNPLWKHLRGTVQWQTVDSVEEALASSGQAWWGLCPRALNSGYPYKAISYTGLGLPTLSRIKWGGPGDFQVIDWVEPLDLTEPPTRIPRGRLAAASTAGLDQLEEFYRRLSKESYNRVPNRGSADDQAVFSTEGIRHE